MRFSSISINTISIIAMLLLASSVASADSEVRISKTKIITKYAYGNSSGMCNGGVLANYCIDQLKDQAKRDGIRQTETSCSIDGGRLDRFSGNCWGNCSPLYIPDNQSAFVTCSLNCDADCYIEIPDEELE